jgi:hypothetical protein
MRAREDSNGDDFLGFCRSSDDLSIGRGGCSMRRVEARVLRLESCCHAWQSLDSRKQPPFMPKTQGNVVPIDSPNCRRFK